MGGEQAREGPSVQRIHDEEVGRGGAGVLHRALLVGALERQQRLGQRLRIARHPGPGGVGRVLARAGDRELDQHGHEGRQDGPGQRAEDVGIATALVARPEAPEHAGPLDHVAEGSDEPGQAGGDGGDEDVAVLHVGELVGQHALELPTVEDAQDALGDGDRGVLRVASGREGVRRLGGDEVDARHRHPLLPGESLDDVVDLGELFPRHRLGPVGRERDPVGEPVHDEVHHQAERAEEQHPLGAAHHVAEDAQQRDEARHQDEGLEVAFRAADLRGRGAADGGSARRGRGRFVPCHGAQCNQPREPVKPIPSGGSGNSRGPSES